MTASSYYSDGADGDRVGQMSQRRHSALMKRALLVAGIAFAVGLTWLLPRVNRVQQQRAAVRRVTELGGSVIYDYKQQSQQSRPATPPGNWLVRAILGDDIYAHVVAVEFSQPVSDDDLRALDGLTDLRGISIHGGTVSSQALSRLKHLEDLALDDSTIRLNDLVKSRIGAELRNLTLRGASTSGAAMEGIAKLPNLASLQIVDTQDTDGVLRSIAECKQLRHLDILRCHAISDQGIASLGKLAELRHLQIVGTPVKNGGLTVLDHFPHLEELWLWNLSMTDADMQQFRLLSSMKRLNLSGCHVTDAGIKCLLSMQHLESLSLSDTLITDAAVPDIARFKKLRWLEIVGTNVTDAAVDELNSMSALKHLRVGPGISIKGAGAIAQALPRCAVEWVGVEGRVETVSHGQN